MENSDNIIISSIPKKLILHLIEDKPVEDITIEDTLKGFELRPYTDFYKYDENANTTNYDTIENNYIVEFPKFSWDNFTCLKAALDCLESKEGNELHEKFYDFIQYIANLKEGETLYEENIPLTCHVIYECSYYLGIIGCNFNNVVIEDIKIFINTLRSYIKRFRGKKRRHDYINLTFGELIC